MKKNLFVVLALVMLVTASCGKSENKSKKEQSPADGSDEIVVSTAPTSNMDFDMFHDYEDRGRIFKQKVLAFAGKAGS